MNDDSALDDAPHEDWTESAGLLDVMDDVVETVIEDASDELATLVEMAEDGNCEGVVRTGRALRSAAASLSAKPLIAHCRQIEAAGRAGDLPTVRALLSDAQFEFARLRCALSHTHAA
jgi:HPt (histidine-containing phosphotransfer) domain-containing protein